jgi:hypothetical protein
MLSVNKYIQFTPVNTGLKHKMRVHLGIVSRSTSRERGKVLFRRQG